MGELKANASRWGVTQDRILAALVAGPVTASDISLALINISTDRVGRTLASLMRRGFVSRELVQVEPKDGGRKGQYRYTALVSMEGVWAEACPKCGSSRGSICWSNSSKALKWPHPERFDAALTKGAS